MTTYIPEFIDRVLSVLDTSKPSLTHAIRESEIDDVIQQCTPLILEQPPMLHISAPLVICGDIHGQYSDLLRIFNRCEFPPSQSYLFLGDYVDRGRHQLEVICLLMAYKIRYNGTFFILRGNHECASINKTYGFYEECKRRYTVTLYNAFQELFNSLPLCALVSGRIFCMHGGLSPNLKTWDQLYDIKRPFDPPNKCIAMDLLWADPESNVKGWAKNNRGVSFTFGSDVVDEFCDRMDIDLIARGHQVVQDGYEFFARRRLVTIFSAPKYCGEFENSGSVMVVNANLECRFEIFLPMNKQLKIVAHQPKPVGAQRRPSDGVRNSQLVVDPTQKSNSEHPKRRR